MMMDPDNASGSDGNALAGGSGSPPAAETPPGPVAPPSRPRGAGRSSRPPEPVSREAAILARARALFGDDVSLELRTIITRAGGRTGILVYGYAIVRPVAGQPEVEPDVLGVSPPLGQPLDFSQLGSPEEALLDARRRQESGAGPYLIVLGNLEPSELRAGDPRPALRPERKWRRRSELTTSTLDLGLA